jgi:uncharacterized protein (DUF1778 family)
MATTLEVKGISGVQLDALLIATEDVTIPAASAAIGGASFSTLVLSETDWDFLAQALDAPPVVNVAVQNLLAERTVLDR